MSILEDNYTTTSNDNYDYNYSSNDSYDFSSTNDKNKGTIPPNNEYHRKPESNILLIGCVIIVLSLGFLIFYGIKSFFERSEPNEIIRTETIINKTGYIITDADFVEVKSGPSTNHSTIYQLNKYDQVQVKSQNSRTNWYLIKNKNYQEGYISDEFITFDPNVFKTFYGDFYVEFNNRPISLTSANRVEIEKTLSNLRIYSDDFEILSYDYLNQEATAHHRLQEIKQLIDKVGISNRFSSVIKRWDSDFEKPRNIIVIRSIGVKKSPNLNSDKSEGTDEKTLSTNTVLSDKKLRTLYGAMLTQERLPYNTIIEGNLNDLFYRNFGVNVTTESLRQLGFNLIGTNKFVYKNLSEHYTQKDIFERLILSNAKEELNKSNKNYPN